MTNPLSDRRKQVLKFIAEFINDKSYPPSYREIKTALDIPSTSTVSNDIHQLIEAGYLTMDKGNYRSIQLVEDKLEELFGSLFDQGRKGDRPSQARNDVFDIPIYGNVAAGAPILAEDRVEETIPLPSDFFRNDGEDYFILTISGDSMIEAGIFDGDHVIVRRQNTAQNGDQVVALIEDSATVKTYFRRPDHIELRPENAEMKPIIVRDCRILGVVCGLYRLYRHRYL